MTKVTDDERLIEKSGYFREKWYLRNYPEAAGSGLAPARHYLQEGWKKGFRPSMLVYNRKKHKRLKPVMYRESFLNFLFSRKITRSGRMQIKICKLPVASIKMCK